MWTPIVINGCQFIVDKESKDFTTYFDIGFGCYPQIFSIFLEEITTFIRGLNEDDVLKELHSSRDVCLKMFKQMLFFYFFILPSLI